MAERRVPGGRPLTKRELYLMTTEGLQELGALHGVYATRRDLLAEGILKKQNPFRWWDALRRLRTLPQYHGKEDDFLASEAERELDLVPGTATAKDLGELWKLSGPRKGRHTASIDIPLTRCEVLVEIGKHEDFRGLGTLQIERKISEEGRYGGPEPHDEKILSVSELSEVLRNLGGPSSYSPADPSHDVAAAYRRLRGTERFHGMTNREIAAVTSELSDGNDVVSIARGFDFWERKEVRESLACQAPGGGSGKARNGPSPREVLRGLREGEKFRGMTDQEVLEEAEEMAHTKFVGVDDLVRIMGGTPVPTRTPLPPRRPTRGRRWWDAMRRYRTLKWGGMDSDSEITKVAARESGLLPGEVTADDISWAYEIRRPYGMREEARTQRVLTGKEVLYELAKFPRYDGMGPREIAAGDGDAQLRARLRKLGGPSSSHPERPEGW